jgi:hemerythrin-like domain-containing protein
MTTAAPASPPLADPWEMALIHRILRQGFDEVKQLVESAPPGAFERSRMIGGYIEFTLDGLHNHHTTEDELLWPALNERAKLSHALIARMEAQHAAVETAVEEVRRLLEPWIQAPSAEASSALTDALGAVITALAEHLAEEERDVVPLIALHVTQQEWETLGKTAFDKFAPSQRFTAMGQMLEVATPDEAAKMLAGLPAPIKIIWRLVGKRKYNRYIDNVRG